MMKTDVEMLLRFGLELLVAGLQVIVNDGISALAVEADLAVPPQYDRHSLADIVEIENAQQFVDFRLPHHLPSKEGNSWRNKETDGIR